jgi:cobyrinic acid a,c-diamide synthase
MELITRKTVAEKLAAYLQHELSLDNLVAWAESAMMDGEFDPAHFSTICDVVARIGVADVRAFGLTWEDCEQLLTQLGYSAQVNIVAR